MTTLDLSALASSTSRSGRMLVEAVDQTLLAAANGRVKLRQLAVVQLARPRMEGFALIEVDIKVRAAQASRATRDQSAPT